MKVGTITKQPGERVSVSIYYTEGLDQGDELSAIESCAVFPEGELSATPILPSTDRVRIWLDQGMDGVTYKITITVSTGGGERLEDEVLCRVKEI